MSQIRNLFDPTRGVHRAIEKVITYQASQEDRLKAEIGEYIVTESIEHQLERFLETFQASREAGDSHEVGVWVSGFYGSGKSSFTKYLGLAFDQNVTVDGQPFLRHLQDRLQRAQTKALLATEVARFPAAVVMLDLASEQIAGATLAEVSTVLYHKVLQHAGYSRNLKVAALERRLRKDNRFGEFEALFKEETGEDWAAYRNDELVVDSLLPRVAHQLYPALFATDQAFTTSSSDFIYLMDDRVTEMLDILREATGKENVIFVIDEIGQYVGGDQNKILDLQGLAENLKAIGQGKAWIIGTAQQRLTEDDPHAALNSPALFKLKDRFPISVELESSDIREICYRRLLAKSGEGEAQLGTLFDRSGQALRNNTKLVDAKSYDSGFDRQTFVNLYPFLPAHFDILLRLLGALAKSTGGIGLRSAIKVVQDILIEDMPGRPVAIDQEVGWLATTVTLYDALERDIRRAYPTVHQAVETVCGHFRDDPVAQDVGKTIGILQILGNMPASRHNIASLLHPTVDAAPVTGAVNAAIEAMLNDRYIPLGEEPDGSLRFFSEKLHDIERERGEMLARRGDVQRIVNEALRDVFDPLPSARVNTSLTVTTGIKNLAGGQMVTLAGEKEAVQTVVVMVEPTLYDTERTRLLDESRQKSSENVIYLVGRAASEAEDRATEVYRSRRIAELHRGDPDQEVRDYCKGQTEQSNRRLHDLTSILTRALARGSFLFRGASTAVDTLDPAVLLAARKHLADAAAQVFSRNGEAPERASTDLAEKFLRTAGASLRSLTKQLDPLELVRVSGGSAGIDTSDKALVSIKDYLERSGTVEGRRLLDIFSSPPYGWSQDTIRYLIAALLIAGEIKLKVSGRDVTANGQQAIDALKTNTSFRAVGVSLRDDRPSMETLARAAERLTELCGDQVVPLEDEISKAARRCLPAFQQRLASLGEKLATLRLEGGERVASANQQLADVLSSDGSDAPQHFGGEESPLYETLKWAQSAWLAFGHGIETTVRALRDLARGIDELPSSGAPGQLRVDAREELDRVDELLARNFFEHKADLDSALTSLRGHVARAVQAMRKSETQRLEEAERDLARLPEWTEFTAEEQRNTLSELRGPAIEPTEDMTGLKQLVARQFDIGQAISDLKARIVAQAHARRQRERKAHELNDDPSRTRRALAVPARISSPGDVESLVVRLQALLPELPYAEFDIVIDEAP